MLRRILRSALLLSFALAGCRGSFEAGVDTEDDGGEVEPQDDGGSSSGSANSGNNGNSGANDTDDAGDEQPDAEASGGDDGGVVVIPPGFEILTQMASNEQFRGYLTDQDGRALYFYAGDAPDYQTTCASVECAATWPPFDWGKQYADIIEALKASDDPPPEALDYDYFHRVDGLWQVTYKKRPLYYYSGDEGQGPIVTGDGIDQVWFVARDYFVFVRTVGTLTPYARTVQPQGTPYLTDGNGKSLYARLALGVTPDKLPECDATCLGTWPQWAPVGDLTKLAIPSTIDPAKFSSQFQANRAPQLAYEGFPLHYNISDNEPGETRGQEVNAWRLLAPSGF